MADLGFCLLFMSFYHYCFSATLVFSPISALREIILFDAVCHCQSCILIHLFTYFPICLIILVCINLIAHLLNPSVIHALIPTFIYSLIPTFFSFITDVYIYCSLPLCMFNFFSLPISALVHLR